MQRLGDAMNFPEPTWRTCTGCAAQTMRTGLCWDCDQAQAKRSAADAALALASRSLPEAFRNARFGAGGSVDEFVRPFERIADAQQLVVASAQRVALVGPPGAGKTTLGVAMLRAWMARSRLPAVFVEAFALSGGAMKLDDDLVRAPLLLIDDLGAERNMASTLVPELIYQRHAHDRPTWITTGFTPEQVLERYGGGIVRRVYERANVVKLG